MPKKRSIGKSIIFVVIALVVTTTLALGSFIIVSEKRLQTKLSAMKASGSFPTLVQLIGPKVPDDQNGAVIYKQLDEIMKQPDVKKDMRTISDFLSAKSYLKKPEMWKDARVAVKRQAKLVLLIEQAQAKPNCQFPYNQSYRDIDYQSYLVLRKLEILLRANAIIAARDGKMDECAGFILLGCKIVTTTGNNPSSILELSRHAYTAIVSTSIRDVTNYKAFDEKQARSIYDELTKIDFNRCFGRVILAKTNEDLQMIQDCRNKPGYFEDLMEWADWGQQSKLSEYRTYLVNHTWKPIFSSTDTSAYFSHLQHLRSASSMPYWKAKAQDLLVEEEQIPSYLAVTRFMIPVYTITYKSSQKSMSEADGSRIFLALQAYKSRFGSYPSTLKELRSKLGWQIPIDRFSGKDFIYKKQGQGFLLYSIGLDQMDDKGKPTPGGSDPGDIVWKL